MTISATVTVPTRTIPLGPALADTSTRIEVVQHVPIDDGPKQYLRVIDSADNDAFETAVHADHRVADFTAIDRTATPPLYRIEWTTPPPLPAVHRDDIMVERMIGSPSGWTFRVRASAHEALRALQRDTREAGVSLEVGRLDRSDDDLASDRHGLTPK